MTDYQKRIGLIGLSGMLAVLLLCKFCLSVGEASALDFSNTVLVAAGAFAGADAAGQTG